MLPPSHRPWSLPALLRGLVASTLAAASMLAVAEPVEMSDAVLRMLIDRGLVKVDGSPTSAPLTPATPGLGERLREGASEMVITSMNFLGVPYQLGGTNETTGFDCSGFTRYIFEKSIGVVLPRRADEQARAPGLLNIRRDDLRPGDLVFFNTLRRTFSHVGIYVGEGKFIHAPRTGAVVRMEDLRFDYWNKRFTGARRVAGLRQDARVEQPGIRSAAVTAHPELPSDLYNGN